MIILFSSFPRVSKHIFYQKGILKTKRNFRRKERLYIYHLKCHVDIKERREKMIAFKEFPFPSVKTIYLNLLLKFFRKLLLFQWVQILPHFFVNLFLFHQISEWMGNMKNIDHHRGKTFGHVYRLIDDLIAIKNNKKFENCF